MEGALDDYDGSIITVSHDRWFLDKVCDTIWELPGDGRIPLVAAAAAELAEDAGGGRGVDRP